MDAAPLGGWIGCGGTDAGWRVTDASWRVTDGGWWVTVTSLFCQCDGVTFLPFTCGWSSKYGTPPPPLAHARPCLSTGWTLNRCFEEILGPLFLWSRMEDWVFVECLYRERGAQSCL